MNAENAENEIRNTETTVSLKRSSSILKSGDNENQKTMMYGGDETMAFSEMTTKTKKLRRVSFSARIQVKTIDESISSDPNHGNENRKQDPTVKANSASDKAPMDATALMDISNQTTVKATELINSHLLRAKEIQSLEPGDMSLLGSPASGNRTDMLCHSMDLGNNTTYQHVEYDEASILLGNATMMGGCVTMNVTNGDSLMQEQEENSSSISSSMMMSSSSDDALLLQQTRTNLTATMMTMTMARTKRLEMLNQQNEQEHMMDTETSSHEAGVVGPEELSAVDNSPDNQVVAANETTMPEAISRLELTEPVAQQSTTVQQQQQQSTSVLEITASHKTGNMTYNMSLMNTVTTATCNKTAEKSGLSFADPNQTDEPAAKAAAAPSNVTVTLGRHEKSVVVSQEQQSNKTYDVSVVEISRRSHPAATASETYMVDNVTKLAETSSAEAPDATRVISTAPAAAAAAAGNNTYSIRSSLSDTEQNSLFARPIDMSDSLMLVSGSTTVMTQNADPVATRGGGNQTTVIDSDRAKSMAPNGGGGARKPNNTINVQQHAAMLPPEECLNMSNITASNASRLIENFNSSAMLGTNAHMNNILSSTAANLNAHHQMNGTIDLGNLTFDKTNLSVVELIKHPLPQARDKTDTQVKLMNEFKALKELFTEKLSKAREQKNKLQETVGKLNEESDLEHQAERIRNLKLANEQGQAKLSEKRQELAKLKMRLLNDAELYRVFSFQDSMLEKAKTELKSYLVKNQSIEKEYKETSVLYEKLKEKVENNATKLKAIQEGQEDKEKFKVLCQKLFNDKQLPFKIANFENDTIKLSFFYDLIHLDIKISNIINDLSASQQQNNMRDLNQQQRKYLNYPIQQLFFRSSVDKTSGSVLADAAGSSLKKVLGSSKVPVYLRYCIDLIVGEIGEGDLMALKKKKTNLYVKDLPTLITHINLACKCATNLAKDFEHFGTKTMNTNIKCDFDFKNHLLTLELPSVEDACYYRLKLKVLPGAYYQQPIEFSIEPLDDSYFLPNVSRLTNLINNQYFEGGSFRSFLKKLNLF